MDTLSINGTDQSPSTFSESSRTTSSKSTTSGQLDKDREDLTKDNAASPIDLECHIQAERINKILNEVIYKVKLSICLPHLVHENKILRTVLTTHNFYDIMFIFEQYDNPLFSSSLLNITAMEDVKAGDISLKNRLNPELGHLVYILNSCPALRLKIDEMIDEMKSEYSSYETKPPQSGLKYLLLLEHFSDLMSRQLTNTAAEELAAKFDTRKREACNAKLIANIEENTTSLKEEQESFSETMTMKAGIIAQLEQELATLSNDANVKLKKKILDSDRQMVLATRAHKVKLEILTEEEEETREGYDRILRSHIIEEKNQRARRCKCETQLQSWLQKYDLEMADKQVELDEFHEKYKEEKEKTEDLEEKLAEQDKEYIPLMEEREEEYHQEMAEKSKKFLLEHAARVIQVSWRDVLANRAEKKKLKKQIKKMQAAAAAEEKKGGKKK